MKGRQIVVVYMKGVGARFYLYVFLYTPAIFMQSYGLANCT